MRREWEIREPLRTRVLEGLARALVCPVFGHRRPKKMYGVDACGRCGR